MLGPCEECASWLYPGRSITKFQLLFIDMMKCLTHSALGGLKTPYRISNEQRGRKVTS